MVLTWQGWCLLAFSMCLGQERLSWRDTRVLCQSGEELQLTAVKPSVSFGQWQQSQKSRCGEDFEWFVPFLLLAEE